VVATDRRIANFSDSQSSVVYRSRPCYFLINGKYNFLSSTGGVTSTFTRVKSVAEAVVLEMLVALQTATFCVVVLMVAARVTNVLAPGASDKARFDKMPPWTESVSECVVNVKLPVLITR
jgi:hypothetical protein